MRTTTDHVYRLVQSMTKSEKRYFSLRYLSDSQVMQLLFQGLCSLSNYDENQLKEQLPKKSVKHLAVLKSQLTELILKSLNHQHYKKSFWNKVRSTFNECHLLMERHLYDLALTRLERLKKLCKNHQAYTFLIDVDMMIYRINYLQAASYETDQGRLVEELRDHINMLSSNLDYLQTGGRLLSQIRNGVPLDDLIISPLTIEEIEHAAEDELSLRSMINRNTTLAFWYREKGDEEKAMTYMQSTLDLFHQTQYLHFQETFAFTYIDMLRRYLSLYIEKDQPQVIENILNRAITHAKRNKDIRLHLINFYYMQLATVYLNNDLERIWDELMPRIMEHLKEFNLGKERIAALIYPYFILTAIQQERYSESLILVQNLYNCHPKVFPSRRCFPYILEILTHLKSRDNEQALRIIALYRRRVNRNVLPQQEVVEHMILLLQYMAKEDRQRAIAQSKLLLGKLKEAKGFFTKRILKLYGFKLFLESVTENKFLFGR